MLLLHYTGVATCEAALRWLAEPASKVSCHYVIDADGRIVQMVPESLRAWHAGLSRWGAESDINSASIGIEIHNPGHDAGYPAFPPMLRLIRRFHGGGRPVLGLCLGAQLIARAFGREIVKWRDLELGFPALKLTAEGRADRLLLGTPARPRLMQFHEDTFELPEGAKLLIGGDCPNQGFRIGDTTYGVQFHMEVTLADAHAWLRDCREWIQRHCGATADGRIAEVTREIGVCHPAAAVWTQTVTGRWMDLVSERKLWRQDLWPLQASARPARASLT